MPVWNHAGDATALLLAVALISACSGGSDKSSDKGSDDAGGGSTSTEVVVGREENREGAADKENEVSDESSGALIRRLDRLVVDTDGRVLRAGLEMDAAPSSLETLEARLRTARKQLRGLREAAR